jgi:RNA polymerase sigma-70 factor, ECF subfamily
MASWAGSVDRRAAWGAAAVQAARIRPCVWATPKRSEAAIDLHEDRELLDAFRRGDPTVLSRLYTTFAPALTRFLAGGFSSARDGRSVRVAIADPSERLDLVQDTFTKAFAERNRLAYDGIHPYGPFLVRIARNLAIDRLRKSRRWARLVVEDKPVSADDGAPSLIERAADSHSESPETNAARRQIVDVLRSYLATLPVQERELLSLYHNDEASQRTAAEAMGLTRNQVRTLVARVRRGLLAHMQAQGVIRGLDPAELLAAVSLLALLARGAL